MKLKKVHVRQTTNISCLVFLSPVNFFFFFCGFSFGHNFLPFRRKNDNKKFRENGASNDNNNDASDRRDDDRETVETARLRQGC